MDDIGNAKWYVVNVVCNCYSPDAFVSSIVMVVLLSFLFTKNFENVAAAA